MSEFTVPEVKCKACENEVGHYDEPDVDSSALPVFSLHPPVYQANKNYYGVRIVTGYQVGAGTKDTEIYITLIGSKASSGKVKISSCLKALEGTFSRRTYDDLIVECDGDLGEILVVVVGNDAMWACLGTPWFVDFVTVHNFQSKQSDEFPCYYWIGSHECVSFTAHTTTLKDVKGCDVLVHQRKAQIAHRQQHYQWDKFPDTGVPSGIDVNTSHLPPEQRFDRVKSIDFTEDAVKAVAALGLETLVASFDTLDGYEKLVEAMGNPAVPLYETARWTSDVEFGRQMLNGVNPVVIQKCTSLPASFPVIPEKVNGFLNRGLTLEEEMKAGHVYICDLKIMDGLSFRKDCYCAAPLCLLYVNGSNQLVPIAIQLKQSPGEDNPIFYPNDHRIDWLLAKMYYQSANAQFHEICTHYYCCHAAMEAYAMASMRNLPNPHPIFKLLMPHFRYTMAINTRARASLINNGGIIDRIFAIGGDGRVELMRRATKGYTVHRTNIKRSIEERHVGSCSELPGYYYRDDGLKIWEAIEKYVGSIVDEFYSSDTDINDDTELQDWAADIHTNGFPGYFGSPDGHGFPKEIHSKEELVEYCTLIMFTGSAQHASINFGQYEIYGYVPNAPFAMRLPPPTKKGVADYQRLLDSLPEQTACVLGITVAHMLSQYSQDEIYLGNEGHRFTEVRAQRMVQRFQNGLEDISTEIKQRNKDLDVPYTYLLPERVPNSITI